MVYLQGVEIAPPPMITTLAQAADALNAKGFIVQPAATPLPGVWFAVGQWKFDFFFSELAITEPDLIKWANEGFEGLS